MNNQNFLRILEQLTAPKVNNTVFATELGNGKPSLLDGRKPTVPSDIKYASRNVSPVELQDIQKSGYARPPAGGSHFSGGQDKWWSAADEKGQFGRTWKDGPNARNIRVPIDQIQSNKAVPARALQLLDNGRYVPIDAGSAALRNSLARGLKFMGPFGTAVEVGGVAANSLYDFFVPRWAEGESIVLDKKQNDFQRLKNYIPGLSESNTGTSESLATQLAAYSKK